MATQRLLILKPIFNFIDEASSSDSPYRVLLNFGRCLWVLLCNLFLGLFRHFIERPMIDDNHENEEDQAVPISGGCEEEEKSEFTFGFRFQVKEEDLVNYKDVIEKEAQETGDSASPENGVKTMTMTMTMSTSKYQFVSVKNFGGYVEEPQSACFSVQELFVTEGSKEDDVISNYGRKSRNFDSKEVRFEEPVKELNEDFNVPSNGKVDDFKGTECSSGEVLQRADLSGDETKTEFSAKDGEADELQKPIQLNLGNNGASKAEQVNWLGEFLLRNESFCYGNKISQEDEPESFSDNPELVSKDSGDGFFSISPHNLDSASNGDQGPEIPIASLEIKEENQSLELLDDDYIELEPQKHWNSDSHEEHELDSHLENSMEQEDRPRKSIKTWEYDSDEEDDPDVLLEHQELIDQMKMELKIARTGGLPTILEECESPRIKEDLKPLKIDEKLEHRDRMSEIQKFYKSYAEKMRKLDVLNYQTLQAINVLRMKHPDQLNTGENGSLTLSVIKSVLMPSLWPCKLRRIYADPTLKTITELQRDLELVYVGQTCLSWEILHWQYKKAKELEQHDPHEYRSYNQVAIEFQQFHVLLQRFTEDETFQGPRVQTYANQRCLLRGLLQVPAIKDDTLKEKKARREEDGDAVTIATLANMIKESMSVFWEFVRSDKDTTSLILSKVLQGSKAYLQDPADSELLMDIKTTHQKKEKRLKDLLRTGNCIVKKFQKHNEETVLDQHMFVSQVELRLVSRVLSLPRLTRDQLIWCQTKLNNVHFVERRILVEETLFLLFPC